MAVMKPTTDSVPSIYKQGERFCQLVIVPIPDITIVEASELSETGRGEDGYGSTGNEVSAATGTEDKLEEQPQSEPEPAAAQTDAEVSTGQA